MAKTMTDEIASYLLSDGVGYISYWAEATDSTEDAEGNITSVTLNETDGDVKGKVVTLADIKTAANKLIELNRAGKFYGCCSGCIEELKSFEGYDACTADGVIQLAALGEVVYG